MIVYSIAFVVLSINYCVRSLQFVFTSIVPSADASFWQLCSVLKYAIFELLLQTLYFFKCQYEDNSYQRVSSDYLASDSSASMCISGRWSVSLHLHISCIGSLLYFILAKNFNWPWTIKRITVHAHTNQHPPGQMRPRRGAVPASA